MMNNTNQFICQYCNEPCMQMERERKRHWWWFCVPCKAFFLSNLKGYSERIKFKTPGDKKFYELELDLKNKISSLNQVEYYSPPRWTHTDKPMFKAKLLKEFPNLIPNVTPQNAVDKIKTYLIFL